MHGDNKDARLYKLQKDLESNEEKISILKQHLKLSEVAVEKNNQEQKGLRTIRNDTATCLQITSRKASTWKRKRRMVKNWTNWKEVQWTHEMTQSSYKPIKENLTRHGQKEHKVLKNKLLMGLLSIKADHG